MNNPFRYDYGQMVRINGKAPKHLIPDALVAIVGMRQLQKDTDILDIFVVEGLKCTLSNTMMGILSKYLRVVLKSQNDNMLGKGTERADQQR